MFILLYRSVVMMLSMIVDCIYEREIEKWLLVNIFD